MNFEVISNKQSQLVRIYFENLFPFNLNSAVTNCRIYLKGRNRRLFGVNPAQKRLHQQGEGVFGKTRPRQPSCPQEVGRGKNGIGFQPIAVSRFKHHHALLFLACLNLSTLAADSPPPRARVSRGMDPQVIRLFMPDSKRVHKLFNATFLHFTRSHDISSAWKKIVLPTDRVGIKINTQPGIIMSSRSSVVEAVIDGLESAGISRNHIIIFDRYAHQMAVAGYPVGQRPDQVTTIATTPNAGYDPTPSLDFPIPGKLIWGDLQFKQKSQKTSKSHHDETLDDSDQLSTESHFSKIITQQVDKIINIGVPITDPDFGIYGCELNVTLPFIDNFRRLQHPSFAREDSITSIFSSPIIQKKCVLHILDALIAQFAGGPSFDPNYCWTPKAIYISRDAVALDSLALQLINQQRPNAELAPIKDQTAYLQTAADRELGVADLSHIDVQDAPLD